MGFIVPLTHRNTLAVSSKGAQPRGIKQTVSKQALARK